MPNPSKNKTPSFKQLLRQLRADYPGLVFEDGERFKYHTPNQIFYPSAARSNADKLTLLHELGHFLISRNTYSADIELIQIESLAWQEAEKLCAKYQVPYDDDFAQDNLDSYRNWLYAISLCPNCQITGYQDADGDYICPLCEKHWPTPSIRPE